MNDYWDFWLRVEVELLLWFDRAEMPSRFGRWSFLLFVMLIVWLWLLPFPLNPLVMRWWFWFLLCVLYRSESSRNFLSEWGESNDPAELSEKSSCGYLWDIVYCCCCYCFENSRLSGECSNCNRRCSSCWMFSKFEFNFAMRAYRFFRYSISSRSAFYYSSSR